MGSRLDFYDDKGCAHGNGGAWTDIDHHGWRGLNAGRSVYQAGDAKRGRRTGRCLL